MLAAETEVNSESFTSAVHMPAIENEGEINSFKSMAIESKVYSYLNGILASLFCFPSPQTHLTQPALMIVIF